MNGFKQEIRGTLSSHKTEKVNTQTNRIAELVL